MSTCSRLSAAILALLLAASPASSDGIFNPGGPYATATQGQLPGTTTNDGASVGNIGELQEATAAGTAVSLTTITPANIVSKSFAAGDWEISGNCVLAGGATTVITYVQCGLNTVTASLPGEPYYFSNYLNASGVFANVTRQTYVPPTQRFSFASPTTVFLVVNAAFTTSTLTGGGLIHGRRLR